MLPSKQSRAFIAFRMASDAALVHAAVQRVEAFVQQFDIEDASRVSLALRELLMNAVYHGNGNDHERQVAFEVTRLGNERFRLTVEDEGEGFDFNALDLTVPEDPRRIRNRGYIVIRKICSLIMFNERGNRVTVEVDIHAPREEDLAEERVEHDNTCAR